MASSPWGWVDDLELRNIRSDELRNQLNYITTITVLVQISIEKAEKLWGRDIQHESLQGQLDDHEKRLTALEYPTRSGTVETLLKGLLLASIAIPVSWLISQFVATAFARMRMVPIRRTTWRKDFGDTKYKDVMAVGKKRIESWEKHNRKLYEETKNVALAKYPKALKGHPKSLIDGVSEDALGLLLSGNTSGSAATGGTDMSKTNSTNYWDRILHPSNEMETLAKNYAQDARWLEDRGIPVLDENMKSLKRSATGLLPTSATWLTKEFGKILEGEPVDRIRLEDLAKERLAHVWLLEFIALFVPPAADIDSKYFTLGGGEGETPYGHTPLTPWKTRLVPYQVDGRWFKRKTLWKNPKDKARAQAIVKTLRREPLFLKTYADIAHERVSVKPDRTQHEMNPNPKILPLVGYRYDSPELQDAIRDYAYILFAQDIFELRLELNRPQFAEIIETPLSWPLVDRFWKAFASTRPSGVKAATQ